MVKVLVISENGPLAGTLVLKCRSTFSRSRSTGVGDPAGASRSTSVIRPLPLTLPSTCHRPQI